MTEADVAKELADAVVSRANFGGSPAACFWPGFGIAVGEGDKRLDAVICLQCSHLYRYAPARAKSGWS